LLKEFTNHPYSTFEASWKAQLHLLRAVEFIMCHYEANRDNAALILEKLWDEDIIDSESLFEWCETADPRIIQKATPFLDLLQA
jgi:hypothetical protein